MAAAVCRQRPDPLCGRGWLRYSTGAEPFRYGRVMGAWWSPRSSKPLSTLPMQGEVGSIPTLSVN